MKTLGMNVFRERYMGIMQSKSRLDFEEEMLSAKINGPDRIPVIRITAGSLPKVWTNP